MAFNITKNNFAERAEKGHTFEVLAPNTKQPTGWKITVRGDLSRVYKDALKELWYKMDAQKAANKKKGLAEDHIDLEQAKKQGLEMLSARIKTWEGLTEEVDGVEVEIKPTPENIRKILEEHEWVQEQITAEAENKANF